MPRVRRATAAYTKAKEQHRKAAKAVRAARHLRARLHTTAEDAAQEASQFEAEVAEQEANLESNTQVRRGSPLPEVLALTCTAVGLCGDVC